MISNPSPGESILPRLWQVILTYTQVWAFRIQVPFLILYIIAARCAEPRSIVARGGWGLFAIEQVVMLTVTVTDHLKTQLDDWRSSLTPEFRLPHLAVATLAVGLPLWLVPTLLTGPLDVSWQGLTALTVLPSAILAWAVYLPVVAILVGMLLVGVKGGNSDIFISDLMAGKQGNVSTAMIWGAVAALILLWILLARLNGQTSVNRLAAGTAKLRPNMTLNPRNQRPGAIAQFDERMMERISKTPFPSAIRWSDAPARIRQRRVVTAGITPPWFAGASYVLVFTAVTLFFDVVVLMGTGYQLPIQALRNICIVLPLVQPWLFALTVNQRWPLLARESLLPASRAEFAFETGLASFRDLLEGWITCTAVALLIAFALSPGEFLSNIGNISLVIGYAAAVLIFTFAASIWLMRFRHQWISFLGLMACLPIVTSPVLIAFWQHPGNGLHFQPTLAVISIAGLSLTGALLIVDAYHRWCRTELD
jgi:hypothetical protein